MTSQEITQDKFVELCRSDEHKEILDKYMGSYTLVYKLSSGKIIANHKATCRICDSLAELERWLAELLKGEDSGEMLYGKNPYGESFPNYSHDLIGKLLKALHIDTASITSDFLIKVDELINEMSDPEKFRNDYFLHLISIVGECSNKEFNTNWLMELSNNDFNTWYPALQYKNNRISYIKYLWEDMFSDNKEFMTTPLYESYKTIKGIIRINLEA